MEKCWVFFAVGTESLNKAIYILTVNFLHLYVINLCLKRTRR
jgi:hypothetical protein